MAEQIKVEKAFPVPDRKSTDRFGNPSRWILRLEDGRYAFPDFEVDPRQEYYYVEIVYETPRWAKVRLHTKHVHGEWLYRTCKFKCALCGEYFEDCNHPTVRKYLEEEEKRREETRRYWEGIQFIAERIRKKMDDEVRMFNEVVKEMYEVWKNEPQRIIGYKVVGIKNLCTGWELDDEGDFRCVGYAPTEIKEPIYDPDYDVKYAMWLENAKKIAERLVAMLSLFPVKCNNVFCTDGSRIYTDPKDFDPGWIMRALDIDDCILKHIEDFVVEVLGEDFKRRYFDGLLC